MNKVIHLVISLFLLNHNITLSFKPSIYSTLTPFSLSYSTQISSSPSYCDCLIVGGGISGCTTAHNLHIRTNHTILLTESNSYLGGNIQTSHKNSKNQLFIYENGPNTFLTSPSILKLSRELNIEQNITKVNKNLPPWIYFNDRLYPLPNNKIFGSNGILSFLFSDFLSFNSKVKLFRGLFIGHSSPPDYEETIQEYVTRLLGKEISEKIVNPFVSGIYAGNMNKLSMKAAFPKVVQREQDAYKVWWNKFGALMYTKKDDINIKSKSKLTSYQASYQQGLSTLPKAIHQELGNNIVKLQWNLTTIEKIINSSYKYKCHYDTPQGIRCIHTKSIVFTIPAYCYQQRPSILSSIAPNIQYIFQKYMRNTIQRIGIYYPPLATVTYAYPKSVFLKKSLLYNFGSIDTLPGVGILYPRCEKIKTLGTLWLSSMFPNRCPNNFHLLVSFLGGSHDTTIDKLSEEKLHVQVHKDCQGILVQKNCPLPKLINSKVWKHSIPQYELGHNLMMKELGNRLNDEELIMNGGRFWFIGNYRYGVSLGNCIESGIKTSYEVCDYLDKIEKTKVF